MNVAIVQGRVRSEPDRRTSGDGLLLVSFDVHVEGDHGPRQHVPVTWAGTPGSEPRLEVGAVVTVVGSVLRRFYRSGGRTTSRTDVRAERVIRGAGTRSRAAIEAALAREPLG